MRSPERSPGERALYVGIGLAAALLSPTATRSAPSSTGSTPPTVRRTCTRPFQPISLQPLFLVTAIACLYAAALTWNHRWRTSTPRFRGVVAYASNRSFGVFLVHVLVLYFVPRHVRPRPDSW